MVHEPVKRLAVVGLLVLVSCGGAEPQVQGQGVRGTATIGPTCPVVREGEDCEDRPVQTTLLITESDGDLVARVETVADGSFAHDLAPGSYVITADPDADPPGGLRHGVSVPFDVRAGSYTEVQVSFDSGIR